MLLVLVLILNLSSAGIAPARTAELAHFGARSPEPGIQYVAEDPDDVFSSGEFAPVIRQKRPINLSPARRVRKDFWLSIRFTWPESTSGGYREGALSGAALAAFPT